MGYRFSIEQANWIAHVLQPTGAIPKLNTTNEQEDALEFFVKSFSANFYDSSERSATFKALLSLILSENYRPGRSTSLKALHAIGDYFRQIPWVALLLPSGNHRRSDELLTDANFLSEIIRFNPEERGLILQLDKVPDQEIALHHVFPAFKAAFSEITRWLGVLVWTPNGDAEFFETSRDESTIFERLRWLFIRLSKKYGDPNLHQLKRHFSEEMLQPENNKPVRILHVSDLHLGSKLARKRIPRVQSLIRSIVKELGNEAPIVPVITGDLMDTPDELSLGDLRTFMGFMDGLGIEDSVLVLGNHDVRADGWRSPKLEQAVNVSLAPVIWLDAHEIAFACFSSVNGGHLARGYISPDEMGHVGSALDRHPDKLKKFTVIAAVHHHPIPVTRPPWYRRRWYERIRGFEKTEELKDAQVFLDWLDARRIPAVLHGHKHIPRCDIHGNLAVIGCGSTIGKVHTFIPDQTYMSLNIVTVDSARNSLCVRLCAEEIVGGGLQNSESHELIIRSALPRK